MTFTGAFADAAKKFQVKATDEIYAVFFSGLMKLPVKVRITRGDKDYKIDAIPEGVSGQTYVVLSKSSTDFSDEHIIAGPAILEVYPKGMTPKTPHPKCP